MSRHLAIVPASNEAGAIATTIAALRQWASDFDVVVIDESFLDFTEEQGVPTVSAEAARRDNVIVLKSLGKNLGLHGIRAGYAVAHPHLAAKLRKALPHWNVNALAEAVILELHAHLAEYEAARDRQRQLGGGRRVRGLVAVEGGGSHRCIANGISSLG